MLAAMDRTPPKTSLARCTTPDQIAVFRELRSQHLNLKGLLEDYFSGVPYRTIQGISKSEEKFLRAELDKILALYDLLWWVWGDICQMLEARNIYLQDLDIYGPGDAVSKVVELAAKSSLEHWTSGYQAYSQKGQQTEKAFLKKAFQLMGGDGELRKPERQKLEKAYALLGRRFDNSPSAALEFVLTTGARLVSEEEGRQSSTKQRHKRYLKASDKWLKLVRPYTTQMKSHQIINGRLSSA